MFFCCVLHLRFDRSVGLIRFALNSFPYSGRRRDVCGRCLVNQLNRAFLAISQKGKFRCAWISVFCFFGSFRVQTVSSDDIDGVFIGFNVFIIRGDDPLVV